MRDRLLRLIAFVLCLVSPALAADTIVHHPVDGLTGPEYWIVYDVLRENGKLGEKASVVSVLLHEPDKDYVLAWTPGQPIRRKADVIILDDGHPFEGTVDIREKKLIGWNAFKTDEYAPTTRNEFGGGDYIKRDPRVLEALKKRGITDLRLVSCLALPGGYVGLPEQADKRVAWGGCSYDHGVERSWGREIAGIFIVVDPIARKVLRVSDYGEAPMPKGANEYNFDGGPAIPGNKPIIVLQPEGPSFTIHDGEVSWENWRFRFRLDPRVGPVLNLVSIQDGDKRRSILYQGSLAEMDVPYQGKDETTHSRVFLDAGEYYVAAGMLKPLAPGIDCPASATYFSAVYFKEDGAPSTRPQLACMYERTNGDPSWRHDEGGVAGRPSRELVLRSTAVVGNYDYIFDWRFEENGSIKVGVAATGIVEVTSVNRATAEMGGHAGHEMPTEYGHLVDQNIEAINHDHFFSFRLDLDVDGPKNSFMIDRLVQEALPAGVARKSIWVMKPEIATTERKAILDVDIKHPAMWRFINPAKLGPVGYHTSIEIMPGPTEVSLISGDDWPQRRAAFSAHSLWVTPYSPDERYAAGKYVTGSKGNDGLSVWTKADRNIENTDIVAWYTVGFHHVPRAEDWPVMPVMWHDFEIRPYDFFPSNPVINRPMTP